MRRRGGKQGRRAFTLVEALAVVTVVGIVLPATLYCISLSQTASALVKERAQALEIANNQMNLAIVQNTWQSEQSGDEPETTRQFHWSTHTQTWSQAGAAETDLQELHVDVTWGSGTRARTVSLVTLMYAPQGGGL